jgi:hypothetical protein
LEECIATNASEEYIENLIQLLLDQFLKDNEYSEKAIRMISNIFLRIHVWIRHRFKFKRSDSRVEYISAYLLNESIFIN